MDFIKKYFQSRKVVSEEIHGVSKVSNFDDGSWIITTNKIPGSYNGRHYTDYVEDVKQLKREKRHNEAIELLRNLIEAVENELKVAGEDWGVAPWYYEQLAIIFRKEGQYDSEVKILERYMDSPKALGVGPKKLAERLEKARKIRDKS